MYTLWLMLSLTLTDNYGLPCPEGVCAYSLINWASLEMPSQAACAAVAEDMDALDAIKQNLGEAGGFHPDAPPRFNVAIELGSAICMPAGAGPPIK